MPGEVDPALGCVNGTMPAAGLDAGREGEAGDGVADQLALTAAEATDGIAHEQDLSEVIAAQGGAAETLTGAELTVDLGTIEGVQSKVRSAAVRGVGALFSPSGAVEFALEFHLNVLFFPGVAGRRASRLRGEEWLGCVVCELGEPPYGRLVLRAGRGDREGLSGVCGAVGRRELGERCRWRGRAEVLSVSARL